jgi:uncharacterized protein
MAVSQVVHFKKRPDGGDKRMAAAHETQMRYGTGNTMQVILKVSERCNIACKYCYFFFAGDESYKDNPAFISDATVADFATFLKQGTRDYNLERISVIIHGGEPLMLKKDKMLALMETVTSAVGDIDLQFGVQTNAMLVDEEWIALFARFNVAVGVSLDGPAQFNDIDRVDKKLLGTYARTMDGIKLLQGAAARGELAAPGLLCVINPDYPPEVIYQHFIHELGFRSVDFLLPDNNYDTTDPQKIASYGEYLSKLFSLYSQETRPGVTIRFFDRIIASMTATPFYSSILKQFHSKKDIVITVSSAGDIAPDDILRTTDPGLMRLGLNLANATLEDVLLNTKLNGLINAAQALPSACHGCDFSNSCHGGELYHRYHSTNTFDNSSIYCAALNRIHGEVATTIVASGVSIDVLAEALDARPYKWE